MASRSAGVLADRLVSTCGGAANHRSFMPRSRRRFATMCCHKVAKTIAKEQFIDVRIDVF